MYETMAHLYDWNGLQDFAEQVWVRDQAVLQEQMRLNTTTSSPFWVLDLACGTGTLSLMLAQAGYTVIGLDRSAAMLAQARQKEADWLQRDASAKSKPVPLWVLGDMRSFTLGSPVNAVLCHCDSLNHLPDADALQATFQSVFQALEPGGCFLFDLNTLDNYRTFWNGSDTDDGPNYRLTTTSGFNEADGRAWACFQAQEYNEDGQLQFHEETVQERYFDDILVEQLLQAAGFQDIRWEPFNPTPEIPADLPLKTFWQCCRK